MSFNVAIDGPAGAGKSTIAKMVAKDKSFIYVDSGAMYRGMGVYFQKNGIDPADEEKISESCKGADITISYSADGVQQVFLNGENITSMLRTEEIGQIASVTSAYPAVRNHLLDLQRNLAASCNVIMDGRDIGTTILPNADVKIYLTASSFVRAQRRADELREKGEECDFDEILKGIEERDYRDMHRETSPLKKAEDAIELDSSYLGIREVCDWILAVINAKYKD